MVNGSQLLRNIVTTLEEATEFVGEFRGIPSICRCFKREDYREDLKMFHDKVEQHVGDLTLGETVLIHDELEGVLKVAYIRPRFD